MPPRRWCTARGSESGRGERTRGIRSTVSASRVIPKDVLERMVSAVERVRERMERTSGALGAARVPCAVVGGNAVAAWVATVDRAAVRNTQDVDVMIRREDFDAARAALEGAGFVYRRAAGIDLFLDGDGASPRDAVHVIYAGEMVRAGEPAANPDVSDAGDFAGVRVLALEGLVRIKLTAFLDKDRVHLRDLIGVGLVDHTWTGRLPPALAARLQQVLDTPDG